MFTDLIMNYVKNQAIEQVSKKIGIDPALLKGQGGQDAIGSLVTGLFRNTKDDESLKQLDDAVKKDHDGSIFDDATSLRSRGEEGNKIVDHILGDKQGIVTKFLAKKLGISTEQAGTLLGFVAPLVMGALGKTKQETGADAAGLKKLIQEEEEEVSQQSETPNTIMKLLDKDGDGDVDLADFLA